MIYELRVYEVFPGKMEALHRRFEEVTVPLWQRLGVTIVGFWNTMIGPSHNQLVYILAFPDAAAVDAAWTAFRADPEWQAGKAASEVDGPIVSRLTNTLMDPTDYSPMQ